MKNSKKFYGNIGKMLMILGKSWKNSGKIRRFFKNYEVIEKICKILGKL